MIDLLRTRLGQWGTWRRASTNRRIFVAMLTVGGFTILFSLATMVRDLIVAHQFGTSDALDAFLIAFLLPSFVITVVAESLNVALMPIYIQVREQQGWGAAQRLVSSAMVWSIGVLVAVSVLLAILVPYVLPLLASGFGPEKLALARSLFYVLLPILAIKGVAVIWRAVLNAGERFALAAVSPAAMPVMAATVLLAMDEVWGIYALAVGTVAGFVLEAGLLAASLRRQTFSLLPRWHGLDPALRQVMKQYIPMVAGAFLLSSTLLVDQSMAAMLGSGSVSALVFGNKVVALLVSVGSMALGTAILPYFSRLVAISDWVGVWHTLKTYARLILLATIPLTLVLIYLSEPLVSILFQRGAFTSADTQLVSQVQALYLLQIPFYMLGTLLVRLISSLKANKVLMWGAAISLPLDVVLNYAFMQWLGIAGIALSTSVVYFISVCYLTWMLLRLMREKHRQ